MKIYYAHHIWKYDTKIEEYEINLIKEKYPEAEIINPNGGLGYTEDQLKKGSITEADIMSICLDAVKKCDALMFSSMNGVIGKGVYDEVQTALYHGLHVQYLHNDNLFNMASVRIDAMNKSNRLYAIVYLI